MTTVGFSGTLYCRALSSTSVIRPPDRGRPGRPFLSEMAGGTPAIPDWSKRGAGIEPGVHDLRAGREPHAVMRGDVADGFVEPGDAMRHADQIGMQADRHDAAGLRALGVEGVQLAFARRDKLIDRAVARVETRRIVDLVGIGDRDEPLAATDI